MSFGGLKNTELTKEEQKRIHYLCMSYNQMVPNLRHKMTELCDLIGGKYSAALFEVLTNKYKTVKEIAGKHLTNEKKLYGLRKMFFEHFSAVLDRESE